MALQIAKEEESTVALHHSIQRCAEDLAKEKEVIPAKLLAASQAVGFMTFRKFSALIGSETGKGFITSRFKDTQVGHAPGRSAYHWTPPVFLESTSLSIGLQAGSSHRSCILLIQSEAALKALLTAEVKLGTDWNMVGRAHLDHSGSLSREALVGTPDVVVLPLESDGVDMGIALKGASINADVAATVSFYGEVHDPTSRVEEQLPTRILIDRLPVLDEGQARAMCPALIQVYTLLDEIASKTRVPVSEA
eukprot:jgi/Mesvir1/3841/Mv19805-RA.1